MLDGATPKREQILSTPNQQALSQGSLSPPESSHCFELQPHLCCWYISFFFCLVAKVLKLIHLFLLGHFVLAKLEDKL